MIKCTIFNSKWTRRRIYFGCGRNLARGKSFEGSMKNLSPGEYEVATIPSIILIEKYCIPKGKVQTHQN